VSHAEQEWLETDGLGGFTSGPVAGPRRRRYHGLLVAATTPPTGRMMLVSGFEATVDTPGGRWVLSAQRYAPDVITGDGDRNIETFTSDPWPSWVFRLPDGTRIAHELFMRAGMPQIYLSWRLLAGSRAPSPAPELAWARLRVRPLLAGRDFHALMHENPAFCFDPEIKGGQFRYRPYAGGPSVVVAASGNYQHQPYWFRNFVYEEERSRGLDFTEDLASPGEWEFELGEGEASMIFAAEMPGRAPAVVPFPARQALETARTAERARRAEFPTRLERSADQYLVARRSGRTIIAGYPWFGDWGRDTFIAMRGLCLANGRVTEAVDVLAAWAPTVSQGMLPNYFADAGGAPEYNTVDASLWYAVVVAETIGAAGATLDGAVTRHLREAVEAILTGYAAGTRHGIRATDDGLLAAGVTGQQLTWMDARVDGREITPRIGKPVEVQALWLNALAAGAMLQTPSGARWTELLARGRRSFERRFWNEARGCLYDVVDVDHQAGTVDASLRPNQILAVGGLPLSLLSGDRARRVVEVVAASLLTPLGLRSLAPGETGYCPRYEGGVVQRDGAYHQGTVWPWLIGPFVEAYLRVHGGGAAARRAARERFVEPILRHLDEAGLGHVSEIADAEPPHTPRGCPFQAWSLGELLRLERTILADGRAAREGDLTRDVVSTPSVESSTESSRKSSTESSTEGP
jgi:predicted glycogen debranching enzyme